MPNEIQDSEFLINFIIPSHSNFHRLLSAFEYLKYYSILSICFLLQQAQQQI